MICNKQCPHFIFDINKNGYCCKLKINVDFEGECLDNRSNFITHSKRKEKNEFRKNK